MTFHTKVTNKGNLKIDGLVGELLNLHPGSKVFVTVHEEKPREDFDEELLYIPPSLLVEADIDDSNGLISYVEDGAIVITAADEEDDYE